MTPRPRVLVVDDLADNRNLLRQLLDDTHDVLLASDGLEAIALLDAASPPDLMLLDLMMPVMDGFGVLAHLAARDGLSVPVIVVSAATEREARLRALEMGAQDFLTKPFDVVELQLRVRNALALKAARDAQEAYAARLEIEVDRQTAELRAAVEAMCAADRHKDEFLGVLSHELRTPLNFIMGFASILEDEVDGPLSALQRERVARILEGADRMIALVDDLLDLARIQAGKVLVEPAPVAYPDLLARVVAPFAGLGSRSEVEIVLDSTDVGEVLVDADRLGQALTNLVANGLKFTPPGGRVAVRAYLAPEGVRTEVEDTGPGIPPAERERIFEKFRQLDMSDTRRAGGAGLGLSICQALVEAHGGRVEVFDAPGGGSLFRVTLPPSAILAPAVRPAASG